MKQAGLIMFLFFVISNYTYAQSIGVSKEHAGELSDYIILSHLYEEGHPLNETDLAGKWINISVASTDIGSYYKKSNYDFNGIKAKDGSVFKFNFSNTDVVIDSGETLKIQFSIQLLNIHLVVSDINEVTIDQNPYPIYDTKSFDFKEYLYIKGNSPTGKTSEMLSHELYFVYKCKLEAGYAHRMICAVKLQTTLPEYNQAFGVSITDPRADSYLVFKKIP